MLPKIILYTGALMFFVGLCFCDSESAIFIPALVVSLSGLGIVKWITNRWHFDWEEEQ